ncbi:MAG TPA: hypothetical protein VFL12_06880 [Thermoanaerobaculia bacterium]|nr:hypothetical protein [Thermoanaerobaculia bacterium]
MKAFTWDCPKCDSRARVDLPADGDVELRCKACGWIVGDDADISSKAARGDQDSASARPEPMNAARTH